MHVRLGKRAGFCMGVRRALTSALEATAGRRGRLFTYGPLIHNTQVVDLLRRRKVAVLESVEEVGPGDLVVIRAHGVSPDKLEAIRQAGGDVCDATCPHVKRAQETVMKAVAEGAQVIIVGDRGHAEVSGLLGYAGGAGIVVEDVGDVDALPPMEYAYLVAQTTQTAERFEHVAEAVRRRVPRVEAAKTICGSTSSRQKEVVDLARQVDVMIIVGGRHSANTVRLAELARETGVPTFHIETGGELDSAQLKPYRVAGVTAGASTPNWIIEEVVDRLHEIGQRSAVWSFLRGVLSFLLVSHIFLSGGAAALTYAAGAIAGVIPGTLAYLLAGLYLFSMQNLNMFLDYRGGEPVPGRSRRFYERYGSVLAPIAAVTALASLGLSLVLGLWPFLILTFSTVMGGLYSVRLLPAHWHYKRLKDIPGSKNVFFAGAVAVVCVLLPAVAREPSLASVSSWAVALAFTYAVVLALGRAIVFDLKDMQSDQFAGRETIPVLIGADRTKALVAAVTAACGGCFVLSAALGLIPPAALGLVAALAYVAGTIWLYHRRALTTGMGFELAVDSSFYVAAVLALLAWFKTG